MLDAWYLNLVLNTSGIELASAYLSRKQGHVAHTNILKAKGAMFINFDLLEWVLDPSNIYKQWNKIHPGCIGSFWHHYKAA